VPVYESRESLHPIYSYSSDDYFGFMEENEGEWRETFNNVPTYDHTLEIGVGRLPVRTLQEAQEVVSKIIDYSLNSINNLGAWRKNIVFLADDGDNNQHQLDADIHANKVEATYPKFNVQKIYLDAYLQETNGGNERSPQCKQSLINAVEKGALVLNYTGHGGEIGWTQEEVLRSQDFSTWNNNHKLPLMITATCEFGRYDEPTIFSGAEKAVLSPKSGAIALITTTRPVFSSTNFLLNTQIYNYLFEPIASEMPRLGDVIRLTKNNSLSGSINRNFSLLGDPSLRLAYPKNDILITKINQKDVSIEQDSLKALSKVSFEGEIRNTDNSLISNFEGILDVTIFDKVSQKTTLGTQAASPMNFDVRENRLFNGKVSVKNGKFYFETIIPKDIAYNYGFGKISLYATDTTQKVDAGAGKTDIVVGGSNPNPIIDNEPPQIRLFMNDTSFVDGALVGQNPWLIAKLYDENGINISSAGVGHSLTTYLNDSTAYPRVLNDFYTADIDTYKSGEVLYPFRDLPNGFYTLHFKAWDTFNNSAEKNISFIVASNAEMALQNVFNYPNPFSERTTFSFQHNRFEEELQVEIEIFNQKGEKMLQTSRVLPEAKSVVREFNLDLSLNGTKFADGVYVYKLTLRSAKDNTSASAISRLVIIKNP
ncbi:MAG: type IX secretion system sortase PorU, partial [Thermonemataceae bacterium]|nr:type IX secretion system sortase PorU [Thermonemataceae bacterium]